MDTYIFHTSVVYITGLFISELFSISSHIDVILLKSAGWVRVRLPDRWRWSHHGSFKA